MHEDLKLRFLFSRAEYETFRDDLQRSSQLGSTGVVIVPDTDRSEVHIGSFDKQFRVVGLTSELFEVEASFREDPFSMSTQ